MDKTLGPKEQFVKRQTFFNRLPRFYISLFFLITIFATLTYLARRNVYFQSDLAISLLIQRINNPLFNLLMIFITRLGDIWGILILVFGSAVLTYIIHKRRSAILLIISSFGSIALAEVIKRLVSRPRPDPSLIHQLEVFHKADSFPSGHVLFYMGFFGFLLFLTYSQMRKGTLRTTLLLTLTLLLILIGLSRIYLGAHWFSDVLGSYLVGLVWLLLITHFYRKILNKFI